MTPTKFLFGQIAIVFAVAIGGLWFATQWAAWQLGYQAQLGASWFMLAGHPIYRPWSLFGWWYAYDAYAPALFNEAGGIAALSGFAGCAVAITGSLWRARQARLSTTYGSSRWSTPHEIKTAGLFRPAGVFLGQFGSEYLRHDGPEHVMAFAPTRSGKGVGLVVPTLLSWTQSVVIHDIKGENWQLTAGWRSRFSHCLLFNPTDPKSARYNPLLEVRKGPDEVRDVQNIADILVDPEGALERRNHWEKTSHSLLVGVILHVLYAEEEKTLARVASFLSDPKRSFEHTLRAMMATNHLGTPRAPVVHPVVASAAREVLNKSDNERSGVLSTAMSFLGLYRDPTVAMTTAACDWRIADLVDAPRPVSLYLVIPPSDISRTKPLVRLVLNQIGRRLTERLEGDPSKSRKHKLLMMLDEFPALGRLDFFETALAFMAGYGIRAYLIAQSLNQISKAYGENNAILDNCHVRIAFSSNDERTATLLDHEKIALTPDIKETLWSALTSLASAPREERTLTGLSVLLQSNALKSALSTYTLDGPFGRLLDAAEDRLALSDVQCFETENLLHQASVVLPVLTYLFHRLEARFTGRPTLLVLDEAWVYLDNPLFAARIREWLKVLRKKNVSVVFATQSLADIANSSIAPAIIESCPQRIFLPNERAIEPQGRAAYEQFGLNERQIELIARAVPKRQYYLQSRRGNRLFELGLGPIALAFCAASSPADQTLIERVRRPNAPIRFATKFLEARGLDWASSLLEPHSSRQLEAAE